ncbi:metallophosphoesterase [Vibrio sp. S4M6]|uniref:metallophosphoesterase n=1 Tax=Vibrio sinus TaxID=2946865 RepID=UPI002029C3C4|nr:metallophosphoesterase [Vibrio sinus]MCL9782149.1 metallophosphoesterase [Vibrio sinus]
MNKIIQISDSHFCASDKSHKSREHLSAVLEEINRRYDNYVLVFSGDLVMKPNQEHYLALYRFIREYTQSEAYAIPGNHDDISLMRKLASQDEFFPIQDIVEINNTDVVLLDSSTPGEHLGGGKIDLAHFEKVKMKLRKESNKLVFIHHPPFKIGAEWFQKICLDNGERFMESLSQIDNLKYLAYGHCHNYFVKESGPTVFLSCPSSWVQFDHSCDETIRYDHDREIGFNVFSLSDEISHETITLPVS